MVQVQVHVTPLDSGAQKCLRLFECEQDTTVAELKAKVVADVPGAARMGALELVFAGERCEDARQLKHYGVCENWLVQVSSAARARPGAAPAPLTRALAPSRWPALSSTRTQPGASTWTACWCRWRRLTLTGTHTLRDADVTGGC
jgi:hypothetical protein